MKTFRIPEPEWAQAMFTRLKTMISNLKSSIDGAGYITQETDPTVPAWAKAANKPTYTASEVGAVSTTDVANNLTTTAAGKVLDARQGKVLKDLIDGLTIPTKTSDLVNDSGFLSGNDVANNLTTTTAGKVLDARQGKALKDLIDAISVPTKTSDLTNDGDGDSPFVTAAEVGAPDMEQAINVLEVEHGGTGSFDETTACDNLGAAHGFAIKSYDVQDVSDVQTELESRLADYVTSGIVKMDSAVWALFTANTRTGDFIGIISHFNDSPNNYSVFGLEHNNKLIYGQVMITNDPSTGETRAFPSLNIVGN